MTESDQTFEDLLRSSTTAILADKNSGLEKFGASVAPIFLYEYADLLYQQPNDISKRVANVLHGTHSEYLSEVPEFALLAVALASVEIYMEKVGITNLPNT